VAESDIISVSTSLASGSVQVPNFGTALILSNGDNTASWGATLVRSYANLASVAGDFATTTGTYLQAEAYFDQNPNPGLLYVGLRSTSNTTQTFFLDVAGGATPVAVTGNVLSFTINSNAVSYTVLSGDSVHDTFIGHIVTTITGESWYGASGLTVTADTTNGAGEHLVKIVTTAATINDVVINGTQNNYLTLYQAQGVAGSGGSSTQALVSTDLNNIINQQSGFYTILSPFCSAIEVAAIAKAAIANNRAFIYQTTDTTCITVAPATDAGYAANGLTFPPLPLQNASPTPSIFAYEKAQGSTLDAVMGIYTSSILNFADAAWAASKLWTNPGAETWAYASLSGVVATVLTETQRNNVVGTIGAITAGKYANVYESVAGANITEFGITRGGQFFDTVRFLAYINAQIQAAIFAAFIAASAAGSKIPYTQAGISFICGLVLGVLKAGIANGGFSNVPTPTCPPPALSGISNANLTARNLPSISWGATLAGAINTAQVQGTVTVA
jgi:hypothetical protein